MSEKKKSPVKKAFFTSLICSLAVFSTALAFYVKSLQESCGGNVCTSIAVSEQPKADDQNVSSAQSFAEYIKDTVFIGDSRTNGLARYNYIPAQNVMAKDGENHQAARTDRLVHTDSGDVTIVQAVGEKKPVRMMVSFGINGVAFMSEDTFMKEYSVFLDELHAASPDSVLAVQSILPVSKEYETSDHRFANSVIDRYNELLKAMAESKGLRFLDSSSVLKDKNNCLKSEYNSGDGLHFNKAAYDALMQFYDSNRIL